MQNDITRGIFSRTERLLGGEALERMAQCRVIIFGVGGVGSWCAEALVRTGFRRLTIVDSDRVCLTNINRQLMATTATVGEVKVEALRRRLLAINPEAEITALGEVYSAETAGRFHLDEFDYIVDAIDSLHDKALLILHACRTRARFFSSMGAALKLDPTQVRVAEFWKVRGCPLGAALRRRFKKEGVRPARKFQCVYSEELLANRGEVVACDAFGCPCSEGKEEAPEWHARKVHVNGSLVHITAIFGFTLAGLIIKDASQ